jgi:DNA-binding transcriptional regulator YiaG
MEKPCRCQEVLITHIRRRDWDSIVQELQKKGLTRREIGRIIGIAHTSVLNWQQGGEPKESDARRLLALYRRHVGPI